MQVFTPEDYEHLLRHILTSPLGLAEPLNDVAVLLVIPGHWSRHHCYSLLQVLLINIGVNGVYLGRAPLMNAFGCACPTALVVDVGHDETEVAVIIDGEFNQSLYERLFFGGRTCEIFLQEKVLGANTEIYDSLKAAGLDPEIHLPIMARAIKESPVNFCNGAMSVDFEYQGITVQIGTDRIKLFDRLCAEITRAISALIRYCDPDLPPILFDHIILTGGTSRNPLLALKLKSHLQSLLTISGNVADHQAKIKTQDNPLEFRTVPPYYHDLWQSATPLAGWFGGGITAKCVLSDPKNHYTREDLVTHGYKIFTDKPL